MPHITRALLRKRAEHNEGLLTTLEELTLHQEELEGINDVLGSTCRELKILYLQNNLLPRLEHLHHLKRLEYLNVALNNICVVEGLGSCEFLRKLDLTVNFIDFDALEASITHLASLRHLRDLYFVGNPAQTKPWFEGEDEEGREEGEEERGEEEKKQAFFHYVVHRIPQLQFLDGQEITRSIRFVAARHFPRLEARLRVLAARARCEKEEKAAAKWKEKANHLSITTAAGATNEEKPTKHDPETRREIYLELAAQKQAKDARQRALAPRERDVAQEQAQRVATVYAEEGHKGSQEERYQEGEDENKKIKQKNEGKWTYTLRDEDDESSSSSSSSGPNHLGSVTLALVLPRHLDSSLIDVDVHPTHINVIVKGKLLRLLLPKEVRVGESKAKRSKTTGDLMVIMPKVEGVIKRRGRHTIATFSLSSEPIHLSSSSAGKNSSSNSRSNRSSSNISGSSGSSSRRIRDMPRNTLGEEMLAAREEADRCVRISSFSSFSSSSSLPLQPLKEALDARNIVIRKIEDDEKEKVEEGEQDKVASRLSFKKEATERLKMEDEEEEEEEEKEDSKPPRKSGAVQDNEQGEEEEEEWDEHTVPPLI